jgi:hypothetical protein
LTILAHGIDPEGPPVVTYGTRDELATLQAVRHRTQLILLHKRALPWLERIAQELGRLSPLVLTDAKVLQVRPEKWHLAAVPQSLKPT